MPKRSRHPKTDSLHHHDSDSAHEPESTQEEGSSVLASASDGVRSGAADAALAAAAAWKSTERFASRFLYTTCYTMSYGVVFPVMLLAASIPRENAAVRGLIDGGRDARDRADEIHRSRTSEHRPESVAPLPA